MTAVAAQPIPYVPPLPLFPPQHTHTHTRFATPFGPHACTQGVAVRSLAMRGRGVEVERENPG